MNKKAYIINFDKSGVLDTFDYVKFHNQLTTVKGIFSWFHYLQSSYIIITDKNVMGKNVYDAVSPIMPNKQFLILEVKLKNHYGWLTKEAWDWIIKWSNETG